MDVPDDAIVVRGGMSKPKDMRVSAEKHHVKHGEYALSGFSWPEMSAEEIAGAAREESEYCLPQPKMRAATAGAFRAAGYPVIEGPGHVQIKLPNPPTDEDWKKLGSTLGEPIPNPVAS